MSRPLTAEEEAAIARAKKYVDGGPLYPAGFDAIVQSSGEAPPGLSSERRILDRFVIAIRDCGLVGEGAIAKLIYLVLTSRLLEKPVSAGVKGVSSSGKSFTVEQTCRFFPPEAVLAMTAMSQRALIYTKESFEHRTIVLYEVDALREGAEEDMTSYLVRSLLSEGRIDYFVTVRSPEKGEGWVTRKITKDGPTGLIFTTTRAAIHGENETRVLSITSDDSREQTARILAGLAEERQDRVDLAPWLELQGWLQQAESRVTIPYAPALAKLVPPAAVRLRRDFQAVLGLIKACAILHQVTRGRDQAGRIVATLEDYEVVRGLVAPLISEGVGRTVSDATRETVEAVKELASAHPDGVKSKTVADQLQLDPSAAHRRLTVAARGGWVVNQEDRPRKPGRWVVGEALPKAEEILPSAERLQAECEGNAIAEGPDLISDDPTDCTIAPIPGSERGEGAQPLAYVPRDPLRPLVAADADGEEPAWQRRITAYQPWPTSKSYLGDELPLSPDGGRPA